MQFHIASGESILDSVAFDRSISGRGNRLSAVSHAPASDQGRNEENDVQYVIPRNISANNAGYDDDKLSWHSSLSSGNVSELALFFESDDDDDFMLDRFDGSTTSIDVSSLDLSVTEIENGVVNDNQTIAEIILLRLLREVVFKNYDTH